MAGIQTKLWLFQASKDRIQGVLSPGFVVHTLLLNTMLLFLICRTVRMDKSVFLPLRIGREGHR